MGASEPEKPGTPNIGCRTYVGLWVDEYNLRPSRVSIGGNFVPTENLDKFIDWLQRAKAWLEYVPPKPFVPGWYWCKNGKQMPWVVHEFTDRGSGGWELGPRIELPEECGGPEGDK